MKILEQAIMTYVCQKHSSAAHNNTTENLRW